MNSLIRELLTTINPGAYLESLGMRLYPWQQEAVDSSIKRLMLMCARQSGKSTIVAGIATHTAKFIPRSLSIIVSPSKDQSIETMHKVEDYIALDPGLELSKNSSFEKEFTGGSRIVALPGSERSVRGYSGPYVIIVDEAARVLDETYKALRPMLTDQLDAKLILLSTSYGKRGFFYNEWTSSKVWKKILVKPAFRLDTANSLVIPAIPEDEFRQYWAERGVSAYYSPRHKQDWLKEELDSMGPFWWVQEYGCEFLDSAGSLFSMDAIMDAMVDAPVMFGAEEVIYNEMEVWDL